MRWISILELWWPQGSHLHQEYKATDFEVEVEVAINDTLHDNENYELP